MLRENIPLPLSLEREPRCGKKKEKKAKRKITPPPKSTKSTEAIEADQPVEYDLPNH